MDLFLPRQLMPLVGMTAMAATSVVYNAFRQHEQFYPAMVALAASNINMLFVYSFIAMLFCGAIRAMRVALFGAARAVERERLYERAWFAFTETLLAMTIFRDEFNAQLISLFALLLALKCLHWLLSDRVDFVKRCKTNSCHGYMYNIREAMQQSANLTWTFHVRIVVATAVLFCIDTALVAYAIYSVHTAGASIQILFGFEYLIQAVLVSATFIKYLLFVVELRSEDPWEARPVYLAYLNLVTDFLRLTIYLLFFLILFNFYSFPLHILRELFVTATSFLKRLKDIIRARRATANLNTRYPDATPEELSESAICAICREEMQTGKKLHCGHIFHLGCLRSWLQQYQTCPNCRADMFVLEQQQAEAAANVAENVPATPGAGPAQAAAGPPFPPPSPAPAAHYPPGTEPATPAAMPHDPHGAAAAAATAIAAAAGDLSGGDAAAWPPSFPLPPYPAAFGQGDAAAGFLPSFPPFPMGLPPNFFPFEFDATAEGQSLEALSAEELAAMEGRERENVLRRVQFLQQFREELDAMLARFGQYQQVAPPPTLANDTQAAAWGVTASQTAADAQPTSPAPAPLSGSPVASPPASGSVAQADPGSQTDEISAAAAPATDSVAPATAASGESPTRSDAELRRLRLSRLSQDDKNDNSS